MLVEIFPSIDAQIGSIIALEVVFVILLVVWLFLLLLFTILDITYLIYMEQIITISHHFSVKIDSILIFWL